MFLFILRLIHLILFFIVASFGVYYLLGGLEVAYFVSIESFLEEMKQIDGVFLLRLQIVYAVCLILGLVIMIFTVRNTAAVLFYATTFATILLIGDVAIALRMTIPLQKAFLTYTGPDMPIDWDYMRMEWLKFTGLRSVLSATAFLLLMIGLLVEKKWE